MKRNEGKHTSELDAIKNIIAAMEKWGCYGHEKTTIKSAIGYAAYPEYSFRWPQGAAFSVAKIVRKLEKAGVIGFGFEPHGYYLKTNYKKSLDAMTPNA